MRGHITKRGKDSYSIVISLGKDPTTGHRKQQWLSVKGAKKDAEKRLAELLHQLDTGTLAKPSKTNLAEFLGRWLADYAKPNLSPRGFERYESIIKVHLTPRLGRISLTQLRLEHLQEYYKAKLNSGLSPRTVRYHHVVLHKALQTALKWGLVSRNAADGVSTPRPRYSEMLTWGQDEMARFLETAKHCQYYALFYTALYTGMRRSELLALRWQDIDFILSQIYVSRSLHQLKDGSYIFTQPKSERSRRTIALPPSAILTLQDYQDCQRQQYSELGLTFTDDRLVFCQFDGKPLRPNTVSRAWSAMATKAGVKVIRFHDARHTHASIMLKQGIHPKIVQERLGHSTISTTLDTYSHVTPGLQQAAANRFDEVVSSKYNEAAEKVG